MKHPRLKDGRKVKTAELYPLNEIPDELIIKIGSYIAYLLYVGRKDITGNDWGDAFAFAIGGVHLDSPVGIADVVKDKMAWSLKTVKASDPSASKTVRLISGRCSPDYSYGISDPHEDIQQTGRAVLGIWNERINLALDNYNPLRTLVLVRSEDCLSFCLFEEDAHRYATNEYKWEVNKNGNLVAKSLVDGKQRFTWQPHGSQFTVHTDIPPKTVKFTIKRPPVMEMDAVLAAMEFDSSWVQIER